MLSGCHGQGRSGYVNHADWNPDSDRLIGWDLFNLLENVDGLEYSASPMPDIQLIRLVPGLRGRARCRRRRANTVISS